MDDETRLDALIAKAFDVALPPMPDFDELEVEEEVAPLMPVSLLELDYEQLDALAAAAARQAESPSFRRLEE